MEDWLEVLLLVETKYGMKIDEIDFELYLISLKNKVYKLLPLREEGLDWSKYLNTVIVETSGLNELFVDVPQLISLLSKLEGLYKIEDFILYRRTIFECLNIIEDLR